MTPLQLRLLAARVGFSLPRAKEAQLIERYGTAEQTANLALYRADEAAHEPAAWCVQTSRYLAHHGYSPISFRRTGASFFERLQVATASPVHDSRKVSVLIAAYNSANTVEWAVDSILNQTWKNLEVFIVDDASTDDTWRLIQSIAQKDPRVTALRNSRNVGPFVARNRVLSLVTGDFITGHDADDWTHPERIERQIARMDAAPGSVGAGSTMVRLDEQLRFRHFRDPDNRIVDEPANLHPVSSLFRTDLFRQNLGHWDSVRFSGDGELFKRAQKVFGSRILAARLSNLSLDRPASIMNDPVHGRQRGRRKLSPTRVSYRKSYQRWHDGLDLATSYMPFPLQLRKFEAPTPMIVEIETVEDLLRDR